MAQSYLTALTFVEKKSGILENQGKLLEWSLSLSNLIIIKLIQGKDST